MDSLPGWHVCLNYSSYWLPSAHITDSLWTHGNHLFILNLGLSSLHCVHHVYTKTHFPLFESWGKGIEVKTRAGCGNPECADNKWEWMVLPGSMQSGWNKLAHLGCRAGSEDNWICSALCTSQLPLRTREYSSSLLTSQSYTALCIVL